MSVSATAVVSANTPGRSFRVRSNRVLMEVARPLMLPHRIGMVCKGKATSEAERRIVELNGEQSFAVVVFLFLLYRVMFVRGFESGTHLLVQQLYLSRQHRSRHRDCVYFHLKAQE